MPSARTIAIGLALPLLAGCTTTQQKASWVRLNSARLRASETPVRVTSPSRVVRVQQLVAVPGAAGSAVVVRVRNTGSRAVSDLPISVGTVGSGGRRSYLNGAPGLDYFQTHLPVVPAHRELTWVYTTGRRLPRGTPVFAVVGAAPSPRVAVPSSLPRIDVSRDPMPHAPASRNVLRLNVINRSSVTQYQLPVYALVHRGHSYLSAGKATLGELTGGGAARLRLTLVGKPGANVQLEAAPTIFQ